MRIGIDCTVLQATMPVRSGRARFASELLQHLLCTEGEDTFLLLVDGRDASLPLGENPIDDDRYLDLRGTPDRSASALASVDVVLQLAAEDSRVTLDRSQARTATVLFDLLHERLCHRFSPSMRDERNRRIESIRGSDLFLAVSESTRQDFIERKGFAGSRIVTIGSGVNVRRFSPAAEPSSANSITLSRLGIQRPFVLHVGGASPRKQVAALIEAVARLGREVGASHDVVSVGSGADCEREAMMRLAGSRGVRLHFTGPVDDQTLLVLYQSCTLFALPSEAEGAGLALLEAMACGAPVIAGDNTAMPEVVGTSGRLVDDSDIEALAQVLEHLLLDPRRRALARDAGLRRARQLTWAAVARRVLDAIHERLSVNPPMRATPILTADRPPLAIVSCFPPVLSGISEYALNLARALATHYEITLFHDPDVVPSLPDDVPATARPITEFDGNRWTRRLYQLGNHVYHRFMFDLIRSEPGVVTVHDLVLRSLWSAAWRPGDPIAQDASPREILSELCRGSRLVVHSDANLIQVPPDRIDTTHVIPFGAHLNALDTDRITEARIKNGLPANALLVGAGGLVHPLKLTQEVALAFAACRQKAPDWMLVFVGAEEDGGATRALVESLQIPSVFFTGPLKSVEFADLMGAMDLAINLRKPPTNGETSAALIDAMRAGVPAIVSDVGTFRHFPDDCVRKTRPGDFPDLVRALGELMSDAGKRRALGQRGRSYVALHHNWDRASALYRDAIERSVAMTR